VPGVTVESEPVWPDTREPSSHHRARRSRVLGVVVVAVLIGVGLLVLRPSSHGGGDPHGRILRALSGPIRAPAGAVTTFRTMAEPHWDSCDGMSGTFGWDDVVAQVGFTTRDSNAAVERAVDAQLRAAGWTRAGTDFWTGVVEGSRATASLERDLTDDQWQLDATAKPSGKAASGC
jgi:hypothetical protein